VKFIEISKILGIFISGYVRQHTRWWDVL